MVQPEWGTKRSCPKCGTRFYDLGKDEPAICIECGEEFVPETVLKSKQPLPYEEAEKKSSKEKESAEDSVADDDLDIDVDEDDDSPDNEVDLGGDDDLGVATESEDDDES